MKVQLADHYGMCFGVRDALRKTHEVASAGTVTVLGQLVHNPVVHRHLESLGVRDGDLENTATASTKHVVITAHGAADKHREAWRAAGHTVTDTTCPLVKKAHHALAQLVLAGYAPVIIGQATHVEVRGLAGDFPNATIILTEADIQRMPLQKKLGVVSQTTQPSAKVLWLVDCLRRRHPGADIQFRDTVCQPTKDRQRALEKLCQESDVIIVVGGNHSNNTRQLVLTAQKLGVSAHQVETAHDLNPDWFSNAKSVGVTAGTSTLDETVRDVVAALKQMDQSSTQSLPVRLFEKLLGA